jgi:hypothetical protein
MLIDTDTHWYILCSHLQTYGWTFCSRRPKKGRNKKGRKEKRQKLPGGHRKRAKQPLVAVIHRVCNHHNLKQTWHLALQQGRICWVVQSLISQPFHLQRTEWDAHPSKLHCQGHLQDSLSQNVHCTEWDTSSLQSYKLFASFVDNVMVIVDSKVYHPTLFLSLGVKNSLCKWRNPNCCLLIIQGWVSCWLPELCVRVRLLNSFEDEKICINLQFPGIFFFVSPY